MIQFLAAVLPASGNYVLNVAHTKRDGTKWHKNYHAETIQDLEQEAIRLDTDPGNTVYYGIASYKDNIEDDGKVRRTQEKASVFKTLAFDVDPKDAQKNVVYTSQKDMVRATFESCDKIGLPYPVFVNSGHGMHGYYPLAAEISKTEWIAISTALRDAFTATGLILDTGKICDPSMVLRPPGTHNKKDTVVEVKLLGQLQTFDAYDIQTKLHAFNKTAQVVASPVKKSGRHSSVLDAILQTDFPPSDGKLLETKCAQLAIVATSGGQVAYELWRLAIGVAKHCEDGRTVAHRWSDQHATYSAKETDAKYDGWSTPPATCKSFDKQNPNVCSGCEHFGRITSPIQVGLPEVSSPVAAPQGLEPKAPKGYSYHGDKIFRVVAGESQFVSDYILFPSTRYKDAETGKTVCLTECKLPREGWHTFPLSMDVLASVSDFQAWLINHQMFVYNKVLVEEMRRYMLTYLQELQLEIESDTMSSSFGWADDTCGGFILGGKLVTRTDTRDVRLANAAADFTGDLVPRGDRDKWIQATSMFNEPGMDIFGMVFLMSIGSPLMVGSGLKSVLVNMFSENSGTGKTTTGLMALSMYGNPHKLMLTVQDTDNSVFKSMGVYGNLPVYVDEITNINDDSPGRLGRIAYFITQGREKRRMNKDGGFQESVEWESITASSSNKNMYSLLGNQMTFEGESMRILQFTVPDTALFKSNDGSTFGYEMSMFLKSNYGLVGEEFVRAIQMGGGPADIYAKAQKDFTKKFDFTFTGKERFWQSAMVVGYAAGRITKALGLTKFDIDACVRAGLLQIRRLRSELDDEKLDGFDTLGLYMGEHASKTVVFKKNTQLTNGGAVINPPPYEAVARVEALCDHKNPFISGRLFINQVHFNSWCNERGVDRKGVFAELMTQGVVIHKDRRIALMRGTEKPLPAVRVFEIEMQHQRFLTIMQQNDLGVVPKGPFTLIQGGANAAESS